jgi:4-hydroxyacetophenone monooxygenase
VKRSGSVTPTSVPSAVHPGDEIQLRASIQAANLPALLMVLFQLTGDRRWLEDPYRPTRTRGLEDNRLGGFSDEIQAEVREAAVAAILAWAAGEPVAEPAPTGELLVHLMSTCMGEPVAGEYASMMAAELGFTGDNQPATLPGDDCAGGFSVIVIGAGVSGLVAAVKLREAGIPCTVLEKNPQAGGTWLENRYPGCGVDTPSYLYSYSFFPNDWSTQFGKRDEVLGYLQRMAEELRLQDVIRYGEHVISVTWSDLLQRHTVMCVDKDGRQHQLEAHAVITAVGQLSTPAIPELPGAETFEGGLFHSARWPDGVDLAGKDVALVGSAATAMQIAPAIAAEVRTLTIFQRSPQWIAPNEDYFNLIDADTHWLMNHAPFYRDWYRFRLAWTFNDKVHPSLVRDPDWPHPERSVNAVNDGHRRYFTQYLTAELAGRDDLIAKALPTYPPFAKRMLLDNGWFATLRRPNVELVIEPIREITASGLRTADGDRHPADVIVLATGFQARRLLHPIDIRGRSGQSLRSVWGEEDPRAYLGMTAPGFPNLFFLYGPNVNLGHGGSYIFLAECQINYIVDLLRKMSAAQVSSVECRRDIHDDYNRRVDEAHESMIWTHPGTAAWYRNAAGRVVTNFPWRVLDFWNLTREADLEDFITNEGDLLPGDRSGALDA